MGPDISARGNMQNVYLVDLGTGTNRNLLPLSCANIASYCKTIPEIRENYRIELRMLRMAPEQFVQSLDQPAVIGFACYLWNLRASLVLARAVKAAFPDCIVVGGGPSIPGHPDSIAAFGRQYPEMDVLVHDEGELPFADLLLAVGDGRHFGSVNGISYPDIGRDGAMVTNPPFDRKIDLDSIPSPFLNGIFPDMMARYGPHITGAIWESTRGCPYACTFCTLGENSGKVRKLSFERACEEIEWVGRNNIAYLASADPNFGLFYERDMAIARKLAEVHAATGYPKFLAWNWAKHSKEKIMHIADVLCEAGIDLNVTLSAQSFDQEVLRTIRRKNISTDEMQELKASYRKRGIPTYTEIILGLPGETAESFRRGLELAMTPNILDSFQAYLCTVLENTEMAEPAYMEKFGIETRDCRVGLVRCKYTPEIEPEIDRVVVATKAMPLEDWKSTYVFMVFAMALYSAKLLFFVINFLRRQTGAAAIDFIEFVIDEVLRKPSVYPHLAKAMAVVKKQRQSILDGETSVSPVAELDDLVLSPVEAITFHLLEDSDGFYAEVEVLADAFSRHVGFSPPAGLLSDIVLYQKARMPVWPVPEPSRHTFSYAVPEYFDAQLETDDTAPPARIKQAMEAILPDDWPTDLMGFCLRRIYGGKMVLPYDVFYESA